MADLNMPASPLLATQWVPLQPDNTASEPTAPAPTEATPPSTNDTFTPELGRYIREMRSFRQDFGPQGSGLPLYIQVHQQAALLLAKEKELAAVHSAFDKKLASADRELAAVHSAFNKKLASADREVETLRTVLAQSEKKLQHALSELSTMEAMQKEFSKMKQYLDFRLDQFAARPQADAPSPGQAAATKTTSSPYDATEGSYSDKGQHATSVPQPVATSQKGSPAPHIVVHALDHPADCQCSVACRQWSEPSHGEPQFRAHSTSSTPVVPFADQCRSYGVARYLRKQCEADARNSSILSANSTCFGKPNGCSTYGAGAVPLPPSVCPPAVVRC